MPSPTTAGAEPNPLAKLCKRIESTSNPGTLLQKHQNDIATLFHAERISIFIYDGKRRELVTQVATGEGVPEIRLPVSTASIAGWAVNRKQIICIADVRDKTALAAIDPDLTFDDKWDKKTGFVTRQVLAVPIIFKTFTFGAIELLNHTGNRPFSEQERSWAAHIGQLLGNAFYRHQRMSREKTNKFEYLLKKFMLTPKELDKAIASARQRGETVESHLVDSFDIAKDEVGRSLGVYYKVPYVAFSDTWPPPIDLISGLKPTFLKKNKWVPLGYGTNGDIRIAIDNPFHLERVDEIKTLFGNKPLALNVAFTEDILRFVDHFVQGMAMEMALESGDQAAVLAASEGSGSAETADEADLYEEVVAAEDSAVATIVNGIIQAAHEMKASDIHIEPQPDNEDSIVRMRVDGTCHEQSTVPSQFRNAIVSRIKIMSDLDIAERRKPQDGKIKFKQFGGADIELRVATLPTQGRSETVALRMLADSKPIPLDQLGFTPENHDRFMGSIAKPYGIIFVCGPTGSGKTTTLHSALGHINTPEKKIWTAEDPVEITQKGLSQVQMQPKIGLNFAAALRAFLRADPDIIMVGEMRDQETARMGIEASLTGHLVFSTLHTNSAPESITRLLNMGMEPFTFADAILCVLAQRLVRIYCPTCRQAYQPKEDQYQQLVDEFKGTETETAQLPPYRKDLTFYRANGCEECNYNGYRGRMGIHELLMGTDDIKKLIETQASAEEIRLQAKKDGMLTLKQDGVLKVAKGLTDLQQVRKVCLA